MIDLTSYDHIRGGGTGFIEMPRGLIAVWGKEAVPFLDGMITNDMKTLEDGQQMLAAFPNAQGRLLAVVRVLRQGERFLIETEEATREKVFNNLFRFTYAGDFFVEDLSGQYGYFEVFGSKNSPPVLGEVVKTADSILFSSGASESVFISSDDVETFRSGQVSNGAVPITDELYETLRIESGIPKYGVDMDETTIIPELGLDGLISYNKGCYIGQEIIARIHFRGHVAKQLTGLTSEPGAAATGFLPGGELTTADGKNAGRITSVAYSPKLDLVISLAFIRYEFLDNGTRLIAKDSAVNVNRLPFV